MNRTKIEISTSYRAPFQYDEMSLSLTDVRCCSQFVRACSHVWVSYHESIYRGSVAL